MVNEVRVIFSYRRYKKCTENPFQAYDKKRVGIPVFIDIRQDTLNLDESLIESAITPKTRAIVPVHYAGVACEMNTIMAIAKQHGIKVVEDAAQGVMASYQRKPLGSIGDLGTYSFHETKNVTSGEGGALLVNDAELVSRGEIIREKGTDRSRFFRGETDRYTWQEAGSSFLPGELIAAFLWAQLEEARRITQLRIDAWNLYHQLIEPLEEKELLKRPYIPQDCQHNAHMYYVLLSSHIDRTAVIQELKKQGIFSVFHYVPLHLSPAGKKFGQTHGDLKVTEQQSERLIRLPLWIGLTEEQQNKVVDVLTNIITKY